MHSYIVSPLTEAANVFDSGPELKGALQVRCPLDALSTVCKVKASILGRAFEYLMRANGPKWSSRRTCNATNRSEYFKVVHIHVHTCNVHIPSLNNKSRFIH